jgi:hypothetical protein
MTFEHALKQGDLDVARAILDELAELPDTGGLWMPEWYADLAREYDRQGRHDDAISLHELAIAWLGEGIELAMRTDDPEGSSTSSPMSVARV